MGTPWSLSFSRFGCFCGQGSDHVNHLPPSQLADLRGKQEERLAVWCNIPLHPVLQSSWARSSPCWASTSGGHHRCPSLTCTSCWQQEHHWSHLSGVEERREGVKGTQPQCGGGNSWIEYVLVSLTKQTYLSNFTAYISRWYTDTAGSLKVGQDADCTMKKHTCKYRHTCLQILLYILPVLVYILRVHHRTDWYI